MDPRRSCARCGRIVPQTFVVEDAGEARRGPKALERAGGRAVLGWSTGRANCLQSGVYAARRQEAGAESLLAATNELEAAGASTTRCVEERS